MGALSGKKTKRKARRNNVDEVSLYLTRRHRGRFLLFNLSSSINSDNFKLNYQVVDCSLPRANVDSIYQLCYALHFWLWEHPSNVAVVYCEDGIARTQLLISCFLVYERVYDNTHEALQIFHKRRTGFIGNFSQIVKKFQLRPSDMQALVYFQSLLSFTQQELSVDVPLQLHVILLHSLPVYDGVNAEPCVPHVSIFVGPHESEVFSSYLGLGAKGPDVYDWTPRSGVLALKPDAWVMGYVTIRCALHNTESGKAQELFSYSFDSRFVSEGVINLNVSQLDTASAETFGRDFSFELAFRKPTVSGPEAARIAGGIRMGASRAGLRGQEAKDAGLKALVANHCMVVDCDLLDDLVEKGFQMGRAELALLRANNNVVRALEILNAGRRTPRTVSVLPPLPGAIYRGGSAPL